jgi:hypothetical protein
MRSIGLWTVTIAVLATTALLGCEKGPMEKAGQKIDSAVDKITGTGPAEKAGEKIDEAVRELKK